MGMKRILLLILSVILAFSAKASHIVGGEFELTHHQHPTSSFYYNLRLILYFDEINGSEGARDVNIFVRIFSRRTNRVVSGYESIWLICKPGFTTDVEYYLAECAEISSQEVRTDRMEFNYYGTDGAGPIEPLYLDPNKFSDSMGYYVVWERCCRNYNITNIISRIPDQSNPNDPNAAGQTFYLEFPPVVKNGQPFINSSPSLFKPLSDFACTRQYYYADFRGEDEDGDSLVYSMVTPLNTHSAEAIPFNGPGSAPYREIRWQNTFSLDNIMAGTPDLKISADGMLTVTPLQTGLYVFAVAVEEFREGIKIGEVRRDFQLVVTVCPTPTPPVVEAKPGDAPDTQYVRDKMNISFPKEATDDSRCINVRVTDLDSQNPDENNQENVLIRAIPLGFKDDGINDDIIPEISNAVLINGSAATFTVCFPPCPYIAGPYKIGIIAQDNSCPLPRMDTIVVTIDVELPHNNEPEFADGLITATILEGAASPVWQIIATDVDGDTLELYPSPENDFEFADFGFTFSQTGGLNGHIEGILTWDTRCDVVDFSQRTDFNFQFLVNDKDFCDMYPPVPMTFDLTMDLFDFHPPVISMDPILTVPFSQEIFKTVAFNVIGDDVDNDKLKLRGEGLTFGIGDYGISFPEKVGTGHIVSPFDWYLNCDKINLRAKESFKFRFIVVDDENRCHYYLADTLDFMVRVMPPENVPPTLTVSGNQSSYTLGETIAFTLTATDLDVAPTDQLNIEMVGAEGTIEPTGYSFQADTPFGPNATFTWTPDCGIFEGNEEAYMNHYTFLFQVKDNRCFSPEDGTLEVPFEIRDVESESVEFLPPNFITPNGDGMNDYFAMVKKEGDEIVSILPKDNCAGTFVKMMVYNRWGEKVYETNKRDFKWFAEGESQGVYFYTLKYTSKEYKGSITISYL
jgi:hypothetical protein